MPYYRAKPGIERILGYILLPTDITGYREDCAKWCKSTLSASPAATHVERSAQRPNPTCKDQRKKFRKEILKWS